MTLSATGKPLIWTCRDRSLVLGDRTRTMAILNATPDSFYDGGRHASEDHAVARMEAWAEAGVALIDIGGESTRPGSDRVSIEEEIRRVIPLVKRAASLSKWLISVDTMKSEVARRAIEVGAHIVNDVSAMRHDPAMSAVVAESGAGVILMHMLGEPKTMQDAPVYRDVRLDVAHFLQERMDAACAAGCALEQLALDPGIGFGKTFAHNWTLLAGLADLRTLGRPVVVGASRKRFLGALCDRDVENRMAASLGVASWAIMKGAHILRVHDAIETCDVATIVDTLLHEERRCYVDH